jgi:hypothetical protein
MHGLVIMVSQVYVPTHVPKLLLSGLIGGVAVTVGVLLSRANRPLPVRPGPIRRIKQYHYRRKHGIGRR